MGAESTDKMWHRAGCVGAGEPLGKPGVLLTESSLVETGRDQHSSLEMGRGRASSGTSGGC